MNLGEIKSELALYIQDSSLETYFTQWINSCVTEIANDFSLPYLKTKEPVDLVCVETEWLYDLPNSYMKNLYKAYDENYNKIIIKRSLDDIDNLDIEHTETADNITHVAVRNTQIGIYPMADETIHLWYYKKPTDLATDETELLCIPAQYHSRVVVSKIIAKAYPLLMDLSTQMPHKSLEYWHSRYHSGLFGDASDMGMINCLARTKGVRRTGGRDPLP